VPLGQVPTFTLDHKENGKIDEKSGHICPYVDQETIVFAICAHIVTGLTIDWPAKKNVNLKY
jgi:hypothetical protein